MANVFDESDQSIFHTCDFSFSTKLKSQLMPLANEPSAVAG